MQASPALPAPLVAAGQPGPRARAIVADLNAPHAARSFVRREFGDQAEDLCTVTVELVTNALRHTRTASIGVSLQPVPGGVLVEVSDGDRAGSPALRDASPLEESGRGLAIVSALSARWGWRPDSQGKTVYAVVPAEGGQW